MSTRTPHMHGLAFWGHATCCINTCTYSRASFVLRVDGAACMQANWIETHQQADAALVVGAGLGDVPVPARVAPCARSRAGARSSSAPRGASS